jgi:hypothetical protein
MWDDAMNGRNLAQQNYPTDDLNREPVMPTRSNKDLATQSQSVFELLSLIAKNEVSLELLRQRLVRDCDDFNTVDAFRMMDKNASCELSKRELADFLTHVVMVGGDRMRALDCLMTANVFKFSHFCEVFVPKSQKVLAELTAKKPKNLKGQLAYTDCFDAQTRELYREAWTHVLDSIAQENFHKANLMRDPSFDIGEAFRSLTNGREITRDDLLDCLGHELDQPHVDILYAKLSG